MKIAIFNYYQRISNRGAETYIRELEKRLSKKYKVDVFCGEKPLPKRWPFFWRFFVDPQGILIGLFTLKHVFKIWRGKYDIVVPTNGGWQPALLRIITWLYGGKMVIPGFSGMGWDDRNNLWTFPDLFVAMSEDAGDWAKNAQSLVKSDFVPGGVDTLKFNPRGKVLKTKLERPVILCIGAYTKEKRMDLVIKAISKLNNASLIINGYGELENDLKKLGERLLGNRFKMIKKINHDDLPEVYRSADLFTTASVAHSAFELVIVEAMASGLPVVVGDDPIRRKIVGNAGILVDQENIDNYKKALEQTLNSDWGDKPRKQAKRYSWDKVANKYEKFFASLIK